MSYFNNSQLILIGANLPHSGFTDRFTSEGRETIVEFRPDFLGNSYLEMPEMNAIGTMLIQAKKGVLFGMETKKKINGMLFFLVELELVKPLQSESLQNPFLIKNLLRN